VPENRAAALPPKARTAFRDALRAALEAADHMTYRDLEGATRAHDPASKGLRRNYIAQLVGRHTPISVAAVRLIADALNLNRCYFLELRAAAVRDALDFNAHDPTTLNARLDWLEAALSASPAGQTAFPGLLSVLTCDPQVPSAREHEAHDTIKKLLEDRGKGSL